MSDTSAKATGPRILILGGTAAARKLAGFLVDAGYRPISSLAGRVSSPKPVPGEMRVGGFGGASGLFTWLQEHPVSAVVDATHPFAAQISANAVVAAHKAQLPIYRLRRTSWRERPDADSWHWVDSHEAASALAGQYFGPILLTVGRQELNRYLGLLETGQQVIARVADGSTIEVPDSWVLLEARGPFSYEHELRLCQNYGIKTIISKDSGGPMTSAKLDVAADLGLKMIMIARPELPAVDEEVDSAAEILQLLNQRFNR